MNRPPTGSMVHWRFKDGMTSEYRFGYVTYLTDGLIRMGRWNGDTVGGAVVNPAEIEWRAYS